jgi:hypothetical protein
MYLKDATDGCFYAWHDTANTTGESIRGVINAEHYLFDQGRWPDLSCRKTRSQPGPVRRNPERAARAAPYSRPSIKVTIHPLATKLIKPRKADFKKHVCLYCGQHVGAKSCTDACYWALHEETFTPMRDLLEVRKAGHMGNGVFVRADLDSPIPNGSRLGAYTGELLHGTDPAVRKSLYVCNLEGAQGGDVKVDSSRCGNWTRFVNSHCTGNNVASTVEVIGGMAFVVFTAWRDLKPGEQLFINYGTEYWTLEGRVDCRCGWKEGSHVPPMLHGRDE